MPISVVCTCARTFTVRDDLAGKRVKCPDCGRPVRVSPPPAAEDPLAGLNDLDPAELKSLPALPAARKKRKSKKSIDSESFGSSDHDAWKFAITPKVMAVFGVVALVGVSFIAALMNPALMLAIHWMFLLSFVLIGLSGTIVAAVGGIGMLLAAFDDDLTTGLLYVFIPGYSLYFMVSKWDEIQSPKIAAVGIAMTLGSPVCMTVFQWTVGAALATRSPAGRPNEFTDWEGRPAPDVTITTVDGKHLKLSELQGRGVILDCWATWCPPCVREIPHLQKVADDLSNDLVVVGISSEDLNKVQAFAKAKSLRYPVGKPDLLPPPYASVSSIPTTFFIDRQGVIRKVLVGYHDYPALRDQASLIVQ